ncbi:hypothetical protein MES5069_800025 [Mesorhizobium escarrei]|uniref:Uncharacterized protein n=1 Tax=Mesorhizobium escarrei TaxID=666018 RepID=A0ABN8KHT4_9HYPH|nr:hypothetical protein MES5069_800025 [Mesorhizobium escarrei]
MLLSKATSCILVCHSQRGDRVDLKKKSALSGRGLTRFVRLKLAATCERVDHGRRATRGACQRTARRCRALLDRG